MEISVRTDGQSYLSQPHLVVMDLVLDLPVNIGNRETVKTHFNVWTTVLIEKQKDNAKLSVSTAFMSDG